MQPAGDAPSSYGTVSKTEVRLQFVYLCVCVRILSVCDTRSPKKCILGHLVRLTIRRSVLALPPNGIVLDSSSADSGTESSVSVSFACRCLGHQLCDPGVDAKYHERRIDPQPEANSSCYSPPCGHGGK